MASTTTTSSPPSSTADSSSASCTTAVPNKYGYVDPMACNAQYLYSPSYSAAIAFAVLFGIVTVAQLTLAILYRKPFCWVMIMACTWEFAAFITRALGAHNQQSYGYAFSNQFLFLLAPLWLNAYAYMTAGRLIYTFHPEKKVWKIKAISIGKYFVWLDVLSFIVQGIGGMMLSPGASANIQTIGKDIYMTGVGIQEFFILLFTALIVRFHIEVSRIQNTKGLNLSKTAMKWEYLAYALYACLALITMRIIYRLVEFSAGILPSQNPLPFHEVYALALDAFPMVLAMTILTVVHPGMVLKGPESEFPSRKERKAEKKATKAAKKEEKAARKKGFAQETAYEPVRRVSDEDVESQGQEHDGLYQNNHGAL